MEDKIVVKGRKIYELSIWANKKCAKKVLDALPTICDHGLYVFYRNNNLYSKTCVFCGKTDSVSSKYQVQYNEDIDATIFGETGEGMVGILRAEVMAKLVKYPDTMPRDFTIALRLSLQYKAEHVTSGLFDYFRSILPLPKFYITSYTANKEDVQRIALNLAHNGFRVYGSFEHLGEYISFCPLDRCGACDALIVVNPDSVINGKLHTSYVSPLMRKCVEEFNRNGKRVFFTNRLPAGEKCLKGKVLSTNYFMLHNIFKKHNPN